MGDYSFFAAKITEKQEKKRKNLLQEKYNNGILKETPQK